MNPSSTHSRYGIPSRSSRFLTPSSGIQKNGSTSNPPSSQGKTNETAVRSVVIDKSTPAQQRRLANNSRRNPLAEPGQHLPQLLREMVVQIWRRLARSQARSGH